jgi:hypothetical protein
MDFARLLEIVGDAPVFETGFLLAGDVSPEDVRRQLSRWTRAGRLYQLRRGVYAPAPPYQKVKPHPFAIANAQRRPSYVSLQAALSHHGMIPEVTPVTTSVTTGRPGEWENSLGRYTFRHVKPAWLHGYRLLEVGQGQQAFVATPEKALLDLVYLRPGGDDPAYLESLRLQSLERLDLVTLEALAEQGGPKLERAARRIAALVLAQGEEYETL